VTGNDHAQGAAEGGKKVTSSRIRFLGRRPGVRGRHIALFWIGAIAARVLLSATV
jgi:hypothetical protein